MFEKQVGDKNAESRAVKSFGFVGAVGGITGGLILMLCGLLLSAIAYFNQMNFDRWTTILIVSAFVFLGVGAHFLDLIEKSRKLREKEKLNL